MDISNMVLTPDMVKRGYRVIESPRDNQVTLSKNGEYIKTWCAVNADVKPKVISGTAYMHYVQSTAHFNDCFQTRESGG